ncbi:hypothetical protein KVP97_07120, partial [Escherichia coli]|nr:hypothetical protein [Escherichia coli]
VGLISVAHQACWHLSSVSKVFTLKTFSIMDKVLVVHAGCGVQNSANSTDGDCLVGLISAAHQACWRLSSVSKVLTLKIFSIMDKVLIVHAGCGVNALSGLQNSANSTDGDCLVGLISAAHQACWRLLSVSKVLILKIFSIMDKVLVVHAGCGVQNSANSTDGDCLVGLISVAHQACWHLSSVSKVLTLKTFSIMDKVLAVHAGCGLHALSGLQNSANSADGDCLVGLISAAHQAWRLSSVSKTFSIK